MERGMVKDKSALEVRMNDLHVGDLVKGASTLEFTYAAEWLERSGTRPLSLSLPLRSKKYNGPEVENYFDNLLPDNEAIRKRIQARFKIHSGHAFDLLSEIGRDCVGAVQLLESGVKHSVREMSYKKLSSSQIAKSLENYNISPLGMQAENDDFRISLAGAQEKTAFLKMNNKWCLPLGATPTSHIFKLPIGDLPRQGIDLSESCENEWLCLEVFRSFELEVPKVSLETFKDQKALVVERFDRKWSSDGSWLMRLPQEDFCQVYGMPSALKYESDGGPGISQIMEVLQRSERPDKDRYAFMKAQYLFWKLAAIDGHAKNFSLFIEAEGRIRLTPFYDIISAWPLVNKKTNLAKQNLKMAMSVWGSSKYYKWSKIAQRHWLSTAKNVKFPIRQMNLIIEEVQECIEEKIKSIGSRLPKGFPPEIYENVLAGIKE
jgi:serine/threonine-protein kinase HipA